MKQDIQAMMNELQERKEKLENNASTMNHVDPKYVAIAIYSDVIVQLQGLIDGE